MYQLGEYICWFEFYFWFHLKFHAKVLIPFDINYHM